MEPRGIRNNNPGNIRHTATPWEGKSLAQGDPDFIHFDTPEYGLRAMAVILRNYQKRHGLNTIRGIISRWAPGSENDTEAYIQDVAARTSILPDAEIDLSDPDAMALLIAAIVHHENGEQPYQTALIDAAVLMA